MSNRSWQGHWGFAATVVAVPSERPPAGPASRFLAASLILFIDAYRILVSPLLGPSCRFHPTCSRYAIEAIERHGPIGGTLRALARLARCHPLCDGGFDPVR